jgi:phosphatidylglycerol:prolipoprotein diacylglycerol transferase
MSFHGGFLGVLVAMGLWTRKHGKHWFDVMDFVAPLVPLGLAAGRIGNFINGELVGTRRRPRTAVGHDLPQSGDMQPRHPSQLYHVGLEGLALFAILWLYSRQVRPGSGIRRIPDRLRHFRFITEFFREPDTGIFGQSYTISMGQWLSLPMILIGIAMLVLAYRKKSL